MGGGLWKNGVVNWAEWIQKFALETSLAEGSHSVAFEKAVFLRQRTSLDVRKMTLWPESIGVIGSDSKVVYLRGF